jgi:hypothetical protein
MHVAKIAAGTAGAAVLAGGLSAALAASASTVSPRAAAAPAGGAIQIFVTPDLTSQNGGGSILIVGAIADHGRTAGNKSGVATLTKGTLTVDLTKLNNASGKPTMLDTATCSVVFEVSAPVTIVSGTGTYVGAHGTLVFHETFAAILPRLANGKCNDSNSAVPVSQYGQVQGAGTIGF